MHGCEYGWAKEQGISPHLWRLNELTEGAVTGDVESLLYQYFTTFTEETRCL